jgi:DNA adenine methylase
MTLKPPIPYLGGKQFLAKKLLPFFPPHTTYVEPFGGAGALLFAKAPNPIEVYNDLDADLVNFMRVLRDRDGLFPDFYHRACLSPYSREEWTFCREHLNDDPNPVERARRFFVLARFSFGGVIGQSFGVDLSGSSRGMIQSASAYHGVLQILPCLSERLMSVLIEQRDFRELLHRYNTPECFLYFDPPYLPATRRSGSYRHEITTADHEALVALLRTSKAKIMLSGYPNALYETLGWKTHTWSTTCHVAGRTKASGLQGIGNITRKQPRTECIWMNYA